MREAHEHLRKRGIKRQLQSRPTGKSNRQVREYSPD